MLRFSMKLVFTFIFLFFYECFKAYNQTKENQLPKWAFGEDKMPIDFWIVRVSSSMSSSLFLVAVESGQY